MRRFVSCPLTAAVGGLAALALAAPASAQDLAFVSERDGNPEIYVMAADGSGQRNVTNDPAEDQAPTWSPDGARIAFIRGFGSDADVWDVAADGSGARRLTTDEGPERAPAYSPDGRRIAFVTERSGGAEIHVMNADGGGSVQVTSSGGTASSPAWSPDGRQIAYWREDDAQIHVVGADGSGDRPVGGGAQQADRDPAWSPDGARLVFTSLRDPANDLDLFAMRTDGSGQVAVVATPAREMEPAWSGDGRIAFSTDRDGNLDVWSMAADGSDQRRLTTSAADDSQPAWKPPPVLAAALPGAGGPGVAPGAGGTGRPSSTRTGTTRRRTPARTRTVGRAGKLKIELLRSAVALRGGKLVVTLRYRLNASASGTFRVHLRGRTVLTRAQRGRKGVNVLRLSRAAADPSRWRGVYSVSVVNLVRRG